jgi:hypothetical protein
MCNRTPINEKPSKFPPVPVWAQIVGAGLLIFVAPIIFTMCAIEDLRSICKNKKEVV